ncbi:MAG: thiamine-phosphate kinase [Gammaproteobacteria bacterium]|nr:thiamine-phosphate kinase [Gammaproteobacteria bacterium]
MAEFDLIRRMQDIICIPDGGGAAKCVVGIGDDGAVLDIPDGQQLVVCTDTVVAGVHFPADTAAAAIGHKALAVNLSDLAAMGADPAWFFMALTLPADNDDWLSDYADGMAGLAKKTGIMLAGGDISSGPLSICITALGLVEKGEALTRAGARKGDLVVVSGTPGSAANALRMRAAGQAPDGNDMEALEFPVPRLALGRKLRAMATSCIDISDGLLADLGHILEQSGVGAELAMENLPCPASLENAPGDERWPLQLAGGDDYELCFTIPPASAWQLEEISIACAVELTVIGNITDRGLVLKTANGEHYEPGVAGYQHFYQAGAKNS